MTYYYDDYVEKIGKRDKNDKTWWNDGTYITPEGTLFDVDGYARVAHAGGFVLPFFMSYTNPDEDELRYFTKEEILQNLIDWEHALCTREYDVNPKEQKMRLALVKYLINIYKSKYTIWDDINEYVDLSYATGIKKETENYIGRDRFLKDVLVMACNYDSVESTLYRTITTSKFNIYETFYDYILHDYKIYQIPKQVYDEKQGKYVNWSLPDYMISDKELRLKMELESICKTVPLEKRDKYRRSKVKIKGFDFID